MTLKIRIHDVGHGHSVHAFTPQGQTVVVDLGCSASFSPLRWLKTKTSTIDRLIVTHPHGDHIDEILELSRLGFYIRQLTRPSWLTSEEVYQANQLSYQDKVRAYLALTDSYSAPIEDCELVGNPKISGGVSIKVFDSRTCGRSNINNHSFVVVFEYLGLKLVVPGDNEPASWRCLLEQPDFLNAVGGAYVFLASHHGRESGYCPDIFDVISPKLCVVSDGRVQDTDAVSRYSYHASGWKVHSRAGLESISRYCVTTRSDGYVEIEIGSDAPNNRYLSVTCN